MSPARLVSLSVLLALVLASAIGLVWMRHQNRVLFVKLAGLQKQRDALNVEFGRQEIEQATWAEPSRIERIARTKLDMIDPPADSIRLLR
ncbi:MAG: cell division protein FtsL [Rhodanobacteraceae bacterium]